jgi:multidrug efflux system membrane fusion protein
VSVAQAAREVVPTEVRSVGNVEAHARVEVKSQIAGQLLRVRFQEGADVNAGDVLFEIDPRPYQEALRQTEAAVASSEAQLRQAQANLARDQAQLSNAEQEEARYKELWQQGVAPQMQYDQYRTAAEAQRESVRADRAAIESARAALESTRAAVARAKLDLSYCEIRSPISGRAGNLLIHAGNLVKANDVPLVVINSLSPIDVTFGVPEQYLGEIRRKNRTGALPVEIVPDEAGSRAVAGRLSTIDNTVNPETGTIRLKAEAPNRERLLWPGQFVNIVLRLDTREATVVPAEAVQASQQGQFLYVVKADHTVEPRQVAMGATVNGKAVIEKGVSPGETVVTDGQLRLYPGAKIEAAPASRMESQAP